MLFDFSGSRGVFVCSGIHSRHPGLFMAAFITLSVSRDARSEARVLVRGKMNVAEQVNRSFS